MRRASPLVLIGLLAAAGCEEKTESKSSSAEADSGPSASKGSAVDPNLAEAVQEVAENPGADPTGGGKAPPERGVFEPGAADKEIKQGTPPQLTLGNAGSGQKVKLSIAPASKDRAQITLSVRTGPRSALPTLDILLAFESPTKKEGDEAPGATDVTARATSVKLSAEQPGRLPEGLDKEIAKLKGSLVRYKLAPNGGAYDFSTEISKTADPGLHRVVGAVAETLAFVHLPVPDEPIGSGAYWMVSSREPYSGADVLTYRMVRVQTQTPTQVTLGVQARRYVASGGFDLEGLPPHEVQEFRCQDEAEVVRSIDPGHVESAQIQQGMLAALVPKGGAAAQQRPMPIQFEVEASYSVPGKSAAP